MAKFYVSVPVWASAGMEVEADNAEEAISKAEEELYPCLCHQCSHEIELSDMDWEKASAEEL